MLSQTANLYKNAYTGLSKKTWYLAIVMLINRSGTMVLPFMTIYCTQQLHFSITQTGIIMALFGAGAIAGAFVGGKITDALGFYPQQVAALLLGGIMFVTVGFLKTFPALCIGTFILSMCNESFRPANSTAVAHYSNVENRTRSYSLNRLAINLGWAVGGALGGFLASINYNLLFWVDGGTNIIAAFLLLKLLPYAKTGSKKTAHKNVVPAQSAYKDKVYMWFILLTIFFAACFFQLFSMQPLYYKTEWHYNEQFIGFLMTLNGIIIVIIEMILVYSLEGTKPLTTFIRIGILLVGIGYAMVNVLPQTAWVAILSVTIITFGEILSMPFMNSFWVSRAAETNRGQYAAMYTIAWSIAQVAAPALGSQVIQHAGYNTLWWLLLAICTIASTGFYFLGNYIASTKAA